MECASLVQVSSLTPTNKQNLNSAVHHTTSLKKNAIVEKQLRLQTF